MARFDYKAPLPRHFRREDLLSFHGRDTQQVSERVTAAGFAKGMLWRGLPGVVSLEFSASELTASFDADGIRRFSAADQTLLRHRIDHLAGLSQPVEEFEQNFLDNSVLGAVIARQRGLRVPQAASPFEALVWAIIGQQISLGAAITIRRRLILACNRHHSSGLLCFPDAETLIKLDDTELRCLGLSQAKAATVKTLSRAVLANELPLDNWLMDAANGRFPAVEIEAALGSLRGIGPWTISYALLRGFAWLDGSLHGDVAVRRSLQHLLQHTDKLSAAFTAQWLQAFAPWRALVAAHLWASQVSAKTVAVDAG